jgi:hypothetical protein
MAIVEHTALRMVVYSGSLLGKAVLTLDKDAGRARLERSVLMWPRKPVEIALADIAEVSVATTKDPPSGSELHTPVMRLRSGEALALPASEADAAETAERVRGFLDLGKPARGGH